MIDKSVPGDRAIRYYPIIDTDDTGMHKVALIPALSDTQLKRDRTRAAHIPSPWWGHNPGRNLLPPLWRANGALHRLQQTGCISLQPLPVRRARF